MGWIGTVSGLRGWRPGGRPPFVKRAYPVTARRASKRWAAGRRGPRGGPLRSDPARAPQPAKRHRAASYLTVRRSFGGAIGVSAVTHAAVFLLILFITARMPEPTSSQRAASSESASLIWIPRPGPGGGGGGGGGDGTPEPPRSAEAAGADVVTVRPRSEPAPAFEPERTSPPPAPALQIDALPAAAGLREMPGAIAALPSASASLGPGSGGGAGEGNRGGVGPGDGVGAGPGLERGSGDGPYRPGSNGVTFPRLLREIAPQYTNGALQARVQGIVELLAVVNADGSVGDVWVTRPLDRVFGIDDEAVRTVRQWRFAPATQLGKPVAVMVPIELQFTIR